jgi:hypothetical protein
MDASDSQVAVADGARIGSPAKKKTCAETAL